MAENRAMPISLATFSPALLQRYASSDVDEILSKVDRDANTWLHVVQPDVAVTTRILEHFGVSGALAEQVSSAGAHELDTSSDRYVFKNFRFIEEAVKGKTVPVEAPGLLIRGSETERFTEGSGSIVVGDKFVLLFEDQRGSPMLARAIKVVFDRERDVRERGLEYLLYRLVKSVLVDNYVTLMRQLMDELQHLEPPLLEGSTNTRMYRKLARLRRELNPFERSLVQVAEFTGTVAGERPRVQAGLSYLSSNLGNDCVRLEKEFSMLRDRTSELIQTYRDNVNTQLNLTMRRLTVLSAILLPLSFITGFYGMNFVGMPTLHWPGTFPIVVAVMAAIVVAGLLYARRQDWL